MKNQTPVRYAVVGLGHIAQVAVLPAFEGAQKNSRLAMLFSDDPKKRAELSKRYGVPALPYEEYPAALRSGAFEAVYIALPNNLHKEYAVRAAEAGIHVLCEKPLTSSSPEARAVVEAARREDVRLMTAYRLHFEHANLLALRTVRSGKIGEPRYFNSAFSGFTRPGDIRLQAELGGGAVWDLGVYCVNAARNLFGQNPLEAVAMSESGRDPRFGEVDEMTAAVLRFPQNRLASFVCSQGAADQGFYEMVGTKGVLRVEPAYEYAEGLSVRVTVDGKGILNKSFPRGDQFAAELVYFSDCVRSGKDPEPSGEEGLIDVRIIEAIYMSANTGRAIPVRNLSVEPFPTSRQEIRRPPHKKPPALVHAAPPHP
jgi:predicted dehydrogenase